MDKEQIFEVGTKVSKTSGDYTFHGEVVAAFKKRSGQIRYVVENEDGILHIFSGKQLTINAQVKSVFDDLTKQRKEISAKIEELQNLCKHPNVMKTTGSNTGNYDPSADIYWEDYNCPDCGKSWRKTLPAHR